MKYRLLFFFMITTSLQLSSQTQEHMRWLSLSDESRGMTLHFYDGTEVFGFGIVNENKNELRFKNKSMKVEEVISLYEIKKIDVFFGNHAISFIFVQPRGFLRPHLLQQLRKGKLNVYCWGPGDQPSQMIEVPKSLRFYFIEKESDEAGNPVIPYPQIARRFKKNAVKYFEDCPALVEKIKSKELKSRDILMIADFYNSECQ